MDDAQDEVDRFTSYYPDARSVDLVVYDLHGTPRGKRIRIQDLAGVYAGGMAFSGSVFGLDPTGHVIEGTGLGLESGDPDHLCRPIPGSLALVPWQSRPLAQVQLTMFERDGARFFGDPRQVLARVLDGFGPLGLTPVAAVELEFYLVDPVEASAAATLEPPISPLTGVRDYGHQVYAIEDLDSYREFLDDVSAGAEMLGLPVTTAVAESSPGQFEVNLHHDRDILRACDQGHALKRLVKGVARRHGLVATFMAKPYPDLSGNGMHLHVSLENADGQNVFAGGGEREPNDALRHALGGCLATLADSTALLAPNANSFRRLRPDTFAPTNASWGFENRSTALRIPANVPAARRIEHRVAGADANPYLVAAAVLGGILHGLQERLDPGPETTGNAGADAQGALPGTWPDALAALDRSAVLRRILGDRFVDLYLHCKRYEREQFEQQVTPLEYHWYLHRA